MGKIYTKLWQYADLASYEHRFDYLRGMENFYWQERGILGLRYMPVRARVLDLGCGDEVYSGLFFSTKAIAVDALDYDDKILQLAKKYHKRPNVNFYQSNVVTEDFPGKDYDIVYLFAVIEHFTPAGGAWGAGKNTFGAKSWRVPVWLNTYCCHPRRS